MNPLRKSLKEYVWENYPEKDLRRAMLIDVNRLDLRNFQEGQRISGKATEKAEKKFEQRLIANGYFHCSYSAYRRNPGIGTKVKLDFGFQALWLKPSPSFRAILKTIDENGQAVFDSEKFKEWKRIYGKIVKKA